MLYSHLYKRDQDKRVVCSTIASLRVDVEVYLSYYRGGSNVNGCCDRRSPDGKSKIFDDEGGIKRDGKERRLNLAAVEGRGSNVDYSLALTLMAQLF